MNEPRFGTAGLADSYAVKKFDPAAIAAYTAGFGLTAFEYQCGRGVRLAHDKAHALGEACAARGIALSVHAPYYISMSSLEEDKRLHSIDYLLQSCALVKALGGKRVIFHSGSCGKQSREEALEKALDTMERAVKACDEAGYGDCILCPETMGKVNQLGTLDEVLALCSVDERIIPCVDFGHLYARSQGTELNDETAPADYAAILDAIAAALPGERAKKFHAHFSRIAYTKGDSQFDQVPPNSFPAKLTRVLFERYKAFNGAADKGLTILSCELIDNNGKELKKCCNNYAKDWNLEPAFIDWMNNANTFCSTLVDRIVPGRIRDPKELAAMEEANGYHDAALDVGEVFGVWVIEGPAELEDKLPFKKAGVNVMVVPDVTPYKKRKVRILNGAHTGFVLGAYLAGFDIVRDCMHNDTIRGFMNKMLHEEIIPTLPLDKKDLEEFASAVEDRFNNPFVNHELMSISLNSTSKWKARNMPSFLAYIEEQKQLPKCLTMSLAAYIAFYSSDIQERTADGLICKRPAGNTYKIQDDAWALDFYYAHKDDTAAQLVHAVLTNTQMWDQDLTKIEGLEAAVLADLEKIRTEGAEAAYKSCL